VALQSRYPIRRNVRPRPGGNFRVHITGQIRQPAVKFRVPRGDKILCNGYLAVMYVRMFVPSIKTNGKRKNISLN
jgi:hypothetical protein